MIDMIEDRLLPGRWDQPGRVASSQVGCSSERVGQRSCGRKSPWLRSKMIVGHRLATLFEANMVNGHGHWVRQAWSK